MSGMITTQNTNVSTYGSRNVTIEVSGVCRQDVMRTSNYTVKVPYSRMSQTIQNISRMGGKIAGISMGEPPKVAQEETKDSGKKKNRNRSK